MAWVAVSRDGSECVCRIKPNIWCIRDDDYGIVVVPSGSIEKLTGRVLTWDDEPVELK